MDAQYSYAPFDTQATIQSHEGVLAEMDASTPAVFTFDVPDGSWFFVCASFTAQTAIKPSFVSSFGEYMVSINAHGNLDGWGDGYGTQAGAVYGELPPGYHPALPAVCFPQPNGSFIVNRFEGPSTFCANGVYNGEGLPVRYDQGYQCFTSGAAGKFTLTISLCSSFGTPVPLGQKLQTLTSTLYLASIQPGKPNGTIIATDTSGGAGPPFTGTATVTVPPVWPGRMFNGYRPPQNYQWSVYANDSGSAVEPVFSGQAPDRLTGQGTPSISWEYDSLPSSAGNGITLECLFQNGLYPHEVPGRQYLGGGVYGDVSPLIGSAFAVLFIPGPPPKSKVALGRANLSAPGSRFCRAEDAFTTDTPPKPAGITFRRGNGPVPKLTAGTLWERTGVFISANPADTSPALAIDHRRLLYAAFSRAGSGVCLKRSDDYGDTWNTEIMAIPNGLMPAMASKHSGLLLAALSGSDSSGYSLVTCYKGTGDSVFSSPKAATRAGGAPLLLQKSGIGLCSAADGPDRWILSVLIKGETTTSEWWSADNGASWTRIPVS